MAEDGPSKGQRWLGLPETAHPPHPGAGPEELPVGCSYPRAPAGPRPSPPAHPSPGGARGRHGKKAAGGSRVGARSGRFIAPHPLPRAQAQDESLPVAGSVLSDACGESNSGAVGERPRGLQDPRRPAPLTHPSAGWCRGL